MTLSPKPFPTYMQMPTSTTVKETKELAKKLADEAASEFLRRRTFTVGGCKATTAKPGKALKAKAKSGKATAKPGKATAKPLKVATKSKKAKK